MATVSINSVRKNFGAVEVVKRLDLKVADGEFLVLVGPSGCGKTTLLRMIAGFETITEGEIRIGDRRINGLRPDQRNLAMVFQSYALYPNMSVEDNMGFGLKMAGVAKAERTKQVREVAQILRLDTYLKRMPAELSGGQRQRVAIGRAIVRHPELFLFDEPLSNLDAALRIQMRVELATLHQRLKATMIYVTHDQVEAMTLADRIVVMNNGIVDQVGPPDDIYDHPATLFVASFIGAPKINLLPATVQATSGSTTSLALATGAEVAVAKPLALEAGAPVTVGIRPESLSLVDDGPLRGTVRLVENLGAETLTYVTLDNQLPLVIKTGPHPFVKVADTVSVAIDAARIHAFDQSGRNVAARAV